MDLRAIDDALKLQTDEAVLKRGRYTATSSTTPSSCWTGRLRWSYSPGSLWLLVAVVSCVRKTHIGCISLFSDTLHEYEAITTLSPMPGQAALREESGCSTRKALPGKRRADVFCAIQDTKRLLDDDAVGCWVTTQRGYHCCRSGV